MSRRSLKLWLIDANGWQRIWFVCSVVCFMYFIVIFPFMETKRGNSFRYERLWAAEKEMKNQICALYMTEEVGKLAKPEYSNDGSTCYHIYSHRYYSDDKRPITETIYQEYFGSNEREIWLRCIGLGFMLATLLTASFYGLGVVTSWVINGFKKSGSQ